MNGAVDEHLDYDAIVVGLGAMGVATLYQLAKCGKRVLGIDKYAPPHRRGASHGSSRVTREAVAEGAAYVPLVRRSHQIVSELERVSGQTFLVRCGTLMIGAAASSASLHGASDFVGTTIDIARRSGIEHAVLSGREIKARYPRLRAVEDDYRGYLEPNAGYMRSDALVAAQLLGAQGNGASVLPNTEVKTVRERNQIVTVETTMGTFRAKRVIMSAGAWNRGLLGAPFEQLLTVTRQVIHWFDVDDPHDLRAEMMPVFMWLVSDNSEDYFTGFPVDDQVEGLKIITSDDGPDIDHETIPASIPAAISRKFGQQVVSPIVEGVRSVTARNATCFYTNTPDHGFIVDSHPEMPAVTVICACSGHGFKHSLAIGEAVAQQVMDGSSIIDLAAFRLSRFGL